MRRLILFAFLVASLAGGLAIAQTRQSEAQALVAAQREAQEATLRSQQLERQADAATSEAAKARADGEALVARIQAAEADITAAETRIRIVENLRAEQRARLAKRQQPVVRLTAALQMMARRPPALALVQPGSIEDVVHVRSLLASTLPIVRDRTAGLRSEIAAGNRLREQAQLAVASLLEGRERLKDRRVALAQHEARQRGRSQALASSALTESDRALALGEEARDISALIGTLEQQARIRQSLAQLPGPMLRPGEAGRAIAARPPRYLLPVQGRLVTGMGEISDAGVHARGLTFETQPNAEVVAPADGRIAYAGRFRGYGGIVVIEHGPSWTSLITNLGAVTVRVGDTVRMGALVGRAGERQPRLTVELRRGGRPYPITPLIAPA